MCRITDQNFQLPTCTSYTNLHLNLSISVLSGGRKISLRATRHFSTDRAPQVGMLLVHLTPVSGELYRQHGQLVPQ
jgi:hypothetical protein